MRRRSCRVLFTSMALCTLWLASASAQIAPTGTHYAGRATDTGNDSGPSDSGGYSAAIPLDMPAARGGLPVPVQVVSSSRGFGAAGLGWDVPLSFVSVDASYRHRRPADFSGSAVAPRIRISVSLPGRSVEMLQRGTEWVGRYAPDLTMRGDGERWRVFDGNGFTYTFAQDDRLVGTGLWLLESIKGAGGATVVLTYSIAPVQLPGVTDPAFSIDVAQASYNPHPSGDCFKNEVSLVYAIPFNATPQSMSLIGSRVLVVRDHRLIAVDVNGRATCTDAPQQLRRYRFFYQADADAQQERLVSVKMQGRAGTPEASLTVPVAEYGYGAASSVSGAARVLQFEQQQPVVSFPTPDARIARTEELRASEFHAPVSASTSRSSATTQNLIDMTGDGRPDLVFRGSDPNNPDNPKLLIARNVPGPGGTTTFAAPVLLNDGVFGRPLLDVRTALRGRLDVEADVRIFNREDIWTQTIDVNGDGRLDVIDATEKPYYWIVYLNTPDSGPSGVKWLKRAYYVGRLYNEFAQRNLIGGYNGYLPLGRRFTGRDHGEWMCWQWTGTSYDIYPPGLDDPETECYQPPTAAFVGDEKTYVEWEVTDLNGDGYPDVIFNSSPTTFVFEDPRPVSPDGSPHFEGSPILREGKFWARPTGAPNQIEAELNVRGLFISDDDQATDPFSAPRVLIGHADCGVGVSVTQADANVTTQRCGVADVNGDGIADRIEDTTVFLGTGLGFHTAHMTLPSLPGAQTNSYEAQCTQQHQPFYHSDQTSGLRDLTGDGIPDFIERDRTGAYKVHVGTGVGFAAPIAVTGGFTGGFVLSRNDESCDPQQQTWSLTNAGLYDLDGDGRPERLNLVGTTLYPGHPFALEDFELFGGSAPGTPEAGRIVRIDNGYGAVTTISYRSAKEDGTTRHQIPSPEIVVSAIETTGERNLGGTLVATRYAYGSMEQQYDFTLDVFRPTGYLRRIESTSIRGERRFDFRTTAQITDSYALEAASPPALLAMPPAQRFGRYLRAGRVSDVTVLAGNINPDPWTLLTVDIGSDARRIAGVHYAVATADARLFADTTPPSDDVCQDMVFPYDFDLSSDYSSRGFNSCSARGFLFTNSVLSWRGSSGPPSTDNVQALSSVRDVDDFGRVTSSSYQNDSTRSDDDFCIDTTYATPVGANERVLSAVSSQRIWNCNSGSPVVYAEEAWEHDKLWPGFVSEGLTTAHTVYRHATDTGAYLSTIREYDIDYSVTANPVRVRSAREDGATRTASIDWDGFGLMPVHTSRSGTNVPTLEARNAVDPVTNELLSTTDENGTVRGAVFDGFGRQIFETIDTPKGHPGGVLVARSYLGFESCDPPLSCDPLGRRVVVKQFTEPVDPSKVVTHDGKITTAYLDELGRQRFTEVALGDDYGNQKLIFGARTYDPLGRVTFEADPYPASQDFWTAYGTTSHFDVDGSLRLMIRGPGPQPFTTTPDPSIERFPAEFRHIFANHLESTTMQGPDALTPGSPQFGVTSETVSTAIGTVLSRSKWQDGSRLEHAEFGYDHLGGQTKMVRYQNASAAADPVEWAWQFDSRGQVLGLKEPASAPQEHIYSDWGEPKKVLWHSVPPEADHSIVRTYDALGRLIHSEEQNGDVTDPATTADYRYDVPSASTIVVPTYVLGRLSSAAAPTGRVDFSYDGYGRVNARSFTDADGNLYVEQHGFHGDGSQAWLQLDLPDNNYQPERVDYEYDSAGRLRWMWFSDGTNTEQLYNASQVDPWGRLRGALFGRKTEYRASFADLGRRLPQDVRVFAGTATRSIAFTGFDPVGREVSRNEMFPSFSGQQSASYDPLGRLSTSNKTQAGVTKSQWSFGYDALGNVLDLNDQLGTADAMLSYQAADRDRICQVSYQRNVLPGSTCNVDYDGFGNITYEPTRSGFNKLAYFNSGAVRSVKNESGTETAYRYDPFGSVQELDVKSGNTLLQSDRHYGAFITTRFEAGQKLSKGPDKSTFVTRQFPGPGLVISRRGASGPWVFQFSEPRGTRFTTDEDGNFLQDVEYAPYGEASSSGAASTEATFTTTQWNEGETVGGFGLVHLGARLYDPVIGRFLSRDPLLTPRTSATSNPYSFAINDPVNLSDPSGLDCEGWLCADNVGTPVGVGLGVAWAVWMSRYIWQGSAPSRSPQASGKPTNTVGSRGAVALSPDFSGLSRRFLEFKEGETLSYYKTVTGLFNLSSDPISVFKGLRYADEHPWETILVIDASIDDRVNRMASGDWRATGETAGDIGMLLGPEGIAKLTGKLEGLAFAGTVTRDGEAAAAAANAAERGSALVRRTLFHYTNEKGLNGIVSSQELRPSLLKTNPNDVKFGNGQYLSDIVPGTKTPVQLSRHFLGQPFPANKYTHFLEIDVTDLNVVEGRPGVFVIPNEVPLDLSGRIISYGPVP